MIKSFSFKNTGFVRIYNRTVPTRRPDGTPLVAGDEWVNLTTFATAVYNGTNFISEGEASTGVYKWSYDANDYVTLTITNSGTATFDHVSGGTAMFIFNDKLKLAAAAGADSASGLLFGVGTSADPALSNVADANFIEIRAKTTATSGDNRLAYFRYDIGGAGANGDCLRAFTDLTAAAATARGTQISLQAGATGYITGLGISVDAQLYIKNEVVHAGGTYAAVNAEIYSEGSTSSVAGVTELAFLRIANSGNETGAGTVDAKAFLFDLSGFTSGAANLWYDHQGAAPTNIEEWVKVKTPAGIRWMPLYDAVV